MSNNSQYTIIIFYDLISLILYQFLPSLQLHSKLIHTYKITSSLSISIPKVSLDFSNLAADFFD